MLVSLCMIVRDEEGLIPAAIASARGLVDEIIVVDTGSSDNTIAVCEGLGAEIITGADRMHKAKARNQAAAAASGEWIFILDADETLINPVRLREYIKTTKANALYVKLAFVDGLGNQTLTYPTMRAFRRGTYQYKYRAHEIPIPVNGWGQLAHTDFLIEHRPPSDRSEWKLKYSLERLELDSAENPDDARVMYYLGRQYMYCKRWGDSIDFLTRYIDAGGSQDKGNAWFCIAQCHKAMENETEMISTLYQACASEPGNRRWWGALAEHYHAKGQEDLAIGALYFLLSQPESPKGYTQKSWYGAHPYDLMARCLWKQERVIEGREYAEKALAIDPENERLVKNLSWFLPDEGMLSG